MPNGTALQWRHGPGKMKAFFSPAAVLLLMLQAPTSTGPPITPGQEQQAKLEETPLSPPRSLMPRKFFLFFDFAYNNPKGIIKAKETALHFIDSRLQPTDEVGVLSYSALENLALWEY